MATIKIDGKLWTMEQEHPYRHEWIGRGCGQHGDPGREVCRCSDDGRVWIKTQGYSVPLSGGARGWRENPWRREDEWEG